MYSGCVILLPRLTTGRPQGSLVADSSIQLSSSIFLVNRRHGPLCFAESVIQAIAKFCHASISACGKIIYVTLKDAYLQSALEQA